MQHRPTLVALALTGALGLAPMGLMAQDGSSGRSDGSSSSSSNQGSGSSSGSSSSGSGSSGLSGRSADSSQSGDRKKDAVAEASGSGKQSGSPFLQTVDEAYTAMRQVRAARLSIFNGETDTAKELVQAATKDMESAQSMLEEFSMPSGQSGDQSGGQPGGSSGSQQASGGSSSGGSGGGGQSGESQRYLPIDLSIGVAEGFLIPEDRADALARANAAFLQGDRRAATRILRDASIDVIARASLIPARKSLDNLKQADELMGQDKFYEANVALKAIEDSVTSRSFALDAMPMQGQGGQGGQGSSGSSGGSQSKGGG